MVGGIFKTEKGQYVLYDLKSMAINQYIKSQHINYKL